MVVSEWLPYLVVAVVDIVGVSFAVEGMQYACFGSGTAV